MILLVPALLIALAVLGWIGWLAFGPHATPVEQPRFFLASRDETTDREENGETPSSNLSSAEYERHLRDRLDVPHLHLGSLSGSPGPSGLMVAPRDSYDPGA